MNPKPITGIKSVLADRADEDVMAMKDFHEEMRVLMESRAYSFVEKRLKDTMLQAIEDLIRKTESGDVSGAAFTSGRINALRYAIGLPQQLLSQP